MAKWLRLPLTEQQSSKDWNWIIHILVKCPGCQAIHYPQVGLIQNMLALSQCDMGSLLKSCTVLQDGKTICCPALVKVKSNCPISYHIALVNSCLIPFDFLHFEESGYSAPG